MSSIPAPSSGALTSASCAVFCICSAVSCTALESPLIAASCALLSLLEKIPIIPSSSMSAMSMPIVCMSTRCLFTILPLFLLFCFYLNLSLAGFLLAYLVLALFKAHELLNAFVADF